MDEFDDLIGDWQDPSPIPTLEVHHGFLIVRDDLLGYGTKVRMLDYLIGHDPDSKHVKEWVYGGSPAYGYAQISLPYLCNRYNKKSVIFAAKRKPENLHPYQITGISLGAIYHWVPMGMLTVTNARAREYVAENPEERKLVPLGLEHPTAFACLARVARNYIPEPKEFWTVGSSGTCNRALQLAWPNADANVVSVGHKMSDREIGNATMYRHYLPFAKSPKPEFLPPFPSVPNYDAKAWEYMLKYANPGALFWNIAS